MIRIAIDGPSGAGKSSVAKLVAEKLGSIYVDTGAMYRAIGLYMDRCGIDADDTEAVQRALEKIEVSLSYDSAGAQKIFLCGEDVSLAIRENRISLIASRFSAIPAVRAYLLALQRDMANRHSVVMDGRDIGTVILPNAELKIFLFASPHIRALRRQGELLEKGTHVDLKTLETEIEKRDYEDRTRAVSPCVPAEDAIMLDNSEMSLLQTADAILKLAEERMS